MRSTWIGMAVVLLLGTGLAACGAAVRPAELVRADELLKDRQEAAKATRAAPAIFKHSREVYAQAIEAFRDGDTEECIRFATLAALRFETAREITLKLAAEDRQAAAEKRVEVADKARAKAQARLADTESRIVRMEKILALQANEVKFKKAREEELRRQEQERKAAAAQLATEQAKQEQMRKEQEQLRREQEVQAAIAQAASRIQAADALGAVKVDAPNLDQAKINLERAKLALSQKKLDEATKAAGEAKARADAAVETAQKAFAKENEKVALLKEREALFKDASAIGGVPAKQDRRGVVLTLYDMFASNKTLVLPEQGYLLDKIADLARKYPRYPIVVEGYTDSRGRDADNLALSQGRAQSVLDYLIQQQKLGFDRLKSSGYGEANPVADNSSAAGRAKNRRVEVIFLFR